MVGVVIFRISFFVLFSIMPFSVRGIIVLKAELHYISAVQLLLLFSFLESDLIS